MTRTTRRLLVAVAVLSAALPAAAERYDIVIRSGQVLDGTGNPWLVADVAIAGGRVAAIGALGAVEAATVIDGTGLVVAPGFIDVHTHADREIVEQPAAANYLLQGVTTVVGGNCGGSRLPLAEHFARVEATGIALNFASFVGHNTVRRKVMGNDDRPPSAEELEKMQALVRQEMAAGALGLSTGLNYLPGRFSATEEVIALARATRPYRAVYTTHMRNQGEEIRASVEEAVRIGREAGVVVQISHIKLADELVWGMPQLILEPVEAARAAGLEVYLDQYPYTATSSGLLSSFPGWAVAGGQEALKERLKDPEQYARIRAAVIKDRFTSQRGIFRPAMILIATDRNHPEYQGKSLEQILRLLGREPTVENAADLFIQLQVEDDPQGVFFQMDEADVATLMRHPLTMIASDGAVQVPGEGRPHPRSYGTFPRVMGRYVREQRVLALADAVRRMTSLPAQAMGFLDRGVLRPGMAADVVVFDPATITDTATFEQPHQYPAGIAWVIVNGRVAARAGTIVDRTAGRVLYGPGAPRPRLTPTTQ
jgi:N-acyl-D-amino-acid deacylase